MLATAEFTGDWVQVWSVMSTGEVFFVQRDAERAKKGRKVVVECAQIIGVLPPTENYLAYFE